MSQKDREFEVGLGGGSSVSRMVPQSGTANDLPHKDREFHFSVFNYFMEKVCVFFAYIYIHIYILF